MVANCHHPTFQRDPHRSVAAPALVPHPQQVWMPVIGRVPVSNPKSPGEFIDPHEPVVLTQMRCSLTDGIKALAQFWW
jgi:hypothetical protein